MARKTKNVFREDCRQATNFWRLTTHTERCSSVLIIHKVALPIMSANNNNNNNNNNIDNESMTIVSTSNADTDEETRIVFRLLLSLKTSVVLPRESCASAFNVKPSVVVS